MAVILFNKPVTSVSWSPTNIENGTSTNPSLRESEYLDLSEKKNQFFPNKGVPKSLIYLLLHVMKQFKLI